MSFSYCTMLHWGQCNISVWGRDLWWSCLIHWVCVISTLVSIFQKKKIPSKLPIQQVSIESIPSICILSIGLAIRLIFRMRVALLVRIFEPLIHFKSDLLNYSISRTCFYSQSKLMHSCLDMIGAFISKPFDPNTKPKKYHLFHPFGPSLSFLPP